MNPLLRADLTFDEVMNPTIRWCKSGHVIPDEMKVYSVRGSTLEKSRWGDYCEACVVGARLLANAKKEKEKAQEPPTEPEPVNPAVLKRQLQRVGFVGGLAEVEEDSPKEAWEQFIESQR